MIEDAIAHYGLTAADLGLATVARKNPKRPAVGGRAGQQTAQEGRTKAIGEDSEVQGRPRQHMGSYGQPAGMVQGCFGFKQGTQGTAGKGLISVAPDAFFVLYSQHDGAPPITCVSCWPRPNSLFERTSNTRPRRAAN